MSESEGQEHHAEIVVVHRHGDHEDGHHGGAWKIAFADFMTAMMAFFLVMWLINSTDDQTLSQVATYFSPIKLTDREVTQRGVHDAAFGGSGNEEVKHEQKKKEGKSYVEPIHNPGERRFPEEELFSDPYDKLAKLAMMATTKPPRPGGGLKQEGHAGGDAFRDPFDPEFRSNADDGQVAGADAKQKAGTSQNKSGKGNAATDPDPQPNPEANARPGPEMAVHPTKRGKMAEKAGEAFGENRSLTGKPGRLPDVSPSENELAGEKRKPVSKHTLASAEENPDEDGEFAAKGGKHEKADKGEADEGEHAEKGQGDNANNGNSIGKGEKPETGGNGSKPESGNAAEKAETAENKEYEKYLQTSHDNSAQNQDDTKENRQRVATNEDARRIERDLIENVKQSNLSAIPDITVSGTPDGVLISLTDKSNFEMFAIGSAEPRPELVVVMEKLGKVLQSQKGNIIVRGHTDSRPYKSKIYDNWRLSTSRAHMSYYMLVRAGTPKYRIERIEGYADRSLKDPKHPRAAENRRIEILLRPPKA